MTKQPKALALADALEVTAEHHFVVAHTFDDRPEDSINWQHATEAIEAAAELRRLHALNAELEKLLTDKHFEYKESVKSLGRYRALNAELLEALKAIISDGVHCDVVPHLHAKALTAIAKARGAA